MRKIQQVLLAVLFVVLLSTPAFSQWSNSGNNYTTGDLSVGTSSSSGVMTINNLLSYTGKRSIDILNTNANLYFGDHVLSLSAKSSWTQVPYLEWRAPNGNRQAYLGWQKDYFNLSLENGYDFSINGGYVGIGSTTPDSPLEIKAAAGGAEHILNLEVSDASTDYFKIQNGTSAGASFMPTIYGYHTSTANTALMLVAGTSSAQDSGTNPLMIFDSRQTSAQVSTRPIFAWASYGDRKMTMSANGNLGIGTTNPDERLTVAGNIHAEEVKVDLSVPGPDYVFEEDYNLQSLQSLEQYIQSNKHLPEVPSATEMEENGIEVGVMNMLLLKKIEELTLHQIELLKLVKAQQSELAELKNKLD